MATAAALVPPRATMGLWECRGGLPSPHTRPRHCPRRTSERSPPTTTAPLTALLRPEHTGRVAAWMAVVGCLAALTHCSSHGIPTIGILHQQSAASALFAGFRSRNELPHVLRPFVGFNSERNHFCLCRHGDVCASGELRSDAALLGLIVRVRWHRQVICTRAAL